MPEIVLGSPHSLRRGYFSRSAYTLSVILLSFYYPFFGRLAIAIGVNGYLSLERYLHRDGWFSKPPLIAVMSESKKLSLSIYHTYVLLLVISLPIPYHNLVSKFLGLRPDLTLNREPQTQN